MPHHLRTQTLQAIPSRRFRTWRRWRALLAVSGATLLVLIANDQLLRYFVRHNRASRVNWLFADKPTPCGLAIVGSSIAKEGVAPRRLAEQSGRSVVQLAWGGRGVAEQALMWELFLEHHPCQTLLLELHPRGLERESLPHPLEEFRYYPHLPNATVFRHLRREFGTLPTLAWQYIPMWGISQFNTQIGWHDVLASRHGEVFDPNAPALNQATADLRELLEQAGQRDKFAGARPLNPRAIAQFSDIVDLAKQHQVQVVAFVAPVFGDMPASTEISRRRYHPLLGNEVPIFIPHGDYLSEADNFQDALHLNARGSRIFTQQLADFIRRLE